MPRSSHALRYGLPGAALAFAALPLYLLTPSLYAEHLGLHLAAVGLLLMATRLIDAFGRLPKLGFGHALHFGLGFALIDFISHLFPRNP